MKAVLASLKPYWYYLVGEGIKTIEVRKTFPKAEDWGKDTFFYMSRDEKSFAEIPKEFQEKYRKHFGKVGLRFVCDRIDEYPFCPYICGYGTEAPDLSGYEIPTVEGEKTGMDYGEAAVYGNKKTLYFWHISNLIIYDKPRELGEFFLACDKPNGTDCAVCLDRRENRCKAITRPPQSWAYVERSESDG